MSQAPAPLIPSLPTGSIFVQQVIYFLNNCFRTSGNPVLGSFFYLSSEPPGAIELRFGRDAYTYSCSESVNTLIDRLKKWLDITELNISFLPYVCRDSTLCFHVH
jgi:hypothetical protein